MESKHLPPLEGYIRVFRFYVSHALLIKILALIAAAVALYLTVLQPLVFADNPPEEQTEATTQPGSDVGEDIPEEPEAGAEDAEEPDDSKDTDEPDNGEEAKDSSAEDSTEEKPSVVDTSGAYYNVTVNIYGDVEVNIDNMTP